MSMDTKSLIRFIKVHQKEIIAAINIAPAGTVMGFIHDHGRMPTQAEIVLRESIKPVTRRRINLNQEAIKYADWMPYEKETKIFEAYDEYLQQEDFG